MSREKKRSKNAPGPSSSAGLLSFYGETTDSIFKIRPEVVLLGTIVLITGVILSSIFLKL